MITTKVYYQIASMIALLLLVVTQTSATTISAQTRNGNYTFTEGTSNLVPLTNTGAIQSGRINNTTKKRVNVTYTAECSVVAASGNRSTWLNIDIEIVDATTGTLVTVLPPTNGTADAFCSSNGTAASDGWAMHAVTGTAILPPGVFRARIRANIQNGVSGNSGWLGDSSLIVWR